MKEFEAVNILKRAQKTYGYANQVTVAMEELAELIAVLAKYPRYPDHETAYIRLRSKIIEEIADVHIILSHLNIMFKLREEEVSDVMDAKLDRLKRWLDASDSQLQTTVDREWKGESKGI